MNSLIFTSSNVSDGNLSLTKGDPNQALLNRKKILKKFGIKLRDLVEITPIHGNQVIVSSDNKTKLFEADGIITNNLNLYLFLLTADCLPIGVYDPENNVIALVHAGRISLEKGIVEQAIQKLIHQFSTNPKKLIIEFGPSIGPCCYKWDHISKLPLWKKYFKDGGLDIRQFALDKLTSLGINPNNIKLSRFCTYHTNKFYSHRKTVTERLPNDFRFGTIIGLKNYAD